MLEHDRPDEPPTRPRLCPLCDRLRGIEAPAHPARELVCAECRRTSSDGEGWRAELGLDLEDEREPEEVAVYCPACWQREFGG